jgi:hypothetical protein
MLNNDSSLYEQAILKGHGNETDFLSLFFGVNLFGTGSLHNCSNLCDFGPEFTEVFEAKIAKAFNSCVRTSSEPFYTRKIEKICFIAMSLYL